MAGVAPKTKMRCPNRSSTIERVHRALVRELWFLGEGGDVLGGWGGGHSIAGKLQGFEVENPGVYTLPKP